MSISIMKQTRPLRLGRRDGLVSAPQPQSGLAHSNCLSNWWCLKGVFSLFLDGAACHHAKGKLHRQTGWNTTEAAQMTAREGKKKKVRAEVQGRGGGRLSLLLFYSPWGKDMFRKLSFRWLNIQIAPPSQWPLRSPPSSRDRLGMLGMRSCCTHPGRAERPHSPLLEPRTLYPAGLPLMCS